MGARPILPPPKSREPGLGSYRPRVGTQILLGPSHDPRIRRTARDLQAQLVEVGAGRFPMAARFGLDDAPRPIILLQWPNEVAAAPLITSALPEPKGEEGYVLDITPERIVLWGGPAGLFYGAQTLRQLIGPGGRVACERITDWPVLPLRGVMLDVARGKVPTMQTLYQVVDLMARCKMNMFQLYNEDAFAWQRHPQIGRRTSQLTADELLALDAYCAERHVDFVPTLQSLGHARGILSLRNYAGLDESGKRWTLSPANPGTYDLLADLFAEYLPNFRSQLFNACCDEPWDLGEGQSAKLARKSSVVGVYVDHVLRLRDMARGYGKQLMIWGDVVAQHPQVLHDLPDDVVILDWWYEADHEYSRVHVYPDAQQPFLVCPGSSTWNSFTARQPNAIGNIDGYVTAAVEHGARGMLLTDWGDNGHFNSLGTGWYVSAYACAAAWAGGAVERGEFDKAFSAFAFGDVKGIVAKAYHAAGAVHEATGLFSFNSSPYFQLLFERVDTGPFCDLFTDAKQRRALKALERADTAIARAQPWLEGTGVTHPELLWGVAMSRHAVHHAAWVREERAAAAGQGTMPPSKRRRVAQKLAKKLSRLRDEFAEVWLLRNRQGMLEQSLARLDRVLQGYMSPA